MRLPRPIAALGRLLPSHYRKVTREHLAQFEALPEVGLFEESRPIVRAPAHAYEHAALLLHGFSSSTQTFATLAPALEARGVLAYAPLITGFGLDDMALLERVEASDWRRDALVAFDLLAAISRRVSVVGVSTGATLGAWVAQRRQVDRLVMIAPNFKLTAGDLRYRRLLESPVLSRLVLAVKPYFEKPIRPGRATSRDVLDDDAARRHLDYPALPTRCVRAIWGVQDALELARMKARRVVVMWGAHDRTVDVAHALAALDAHGVAHERVMLRDSAHNVLIDRERDEAARLVCEAVAAPPVDAEAAP